MKVRLDKDTIINVSERKIMELVRANLRKTLVDEVMLEARSPEVHSKRGRPKKRRFTAEHRRKISESIRRTNRMKAKRKKEMK